jgi:uncharacterized protein (TIGR02996 family)
MIVEEESAFLRAIADAPDDDAPRLVYADWLEERGDPRADYVRVVAQIAGRVRQVISWEDLKPRFLAACDAAPEEWREQVGPWFDVLLNSVRSDRKISTIKSIRQWTARGLADAKAVLDAVLETGPTLVKHHLPLDSAERLRHGIEVDSWPESSESSQREPQCRTSLRVSTGLEKSGEQNGT